MFPFSVDAESSLDCEFSCGMVLVLRYVQQCTPVSLHKFPCVPQASLPGHRVEHHARHPEPECLNYRFYSSVNVLRMYSHQYINILIHVSCHNSGLNWIKGLDLFNIVYFDSKLLQNNSQCRVFQNCYS